MKKTINFSFIRPFSLLYLHCLCQGAVILLSRGFCWGATLWIKRKYLQGHSKDGSLCDTSADVSLQEPWGCEGRFTELLIAELILPDVWRQPCWLARHTDPARDSQNAETGWTTPYFLLPSDLHNRTACLSEELTLPAKQNTTKSFTEPGEDNHHLWWIQQVNNWFLSISPNCFISWEWPFST